MSSEHILLIGPRACGKSTVALSLRDFLPGWRAYDLDMQYDERSRKSSQLMVHAEDYYNTSREILLQNLRVRHAVTALASGTLINPKHPLGDLDLLITCKKAATLVLLLPTKFDWRNRRILYQRELERSYNMPRNALAKLQETTYNHYDKRITFFHDAADFTVYGSNAERIARRIIKRFNLQPTVSDQA